MTLSPALVRVKGLEQERTAIIREIAELKEQIKCYNHASHPNKNKGVEMHMHLYHLEEELKMINDHLRYLSH